MKGICKHCYRKITIRRSAHLRHEHAVDTATGSAVRDNFLTPEECGIDKKSFDALGEGEGIWKLPLAKITEA